MFVFFCHLVGAVLLAANVHLGARKSGVGIDMKRRQRFGNGGAGDAGGR